MISLDIWSSGDKDFTGLGSKLTWVVSATDNVGNNNNNLTITILSLHHCAKYGIKLHELRIQSRTSSYWVLLCVRNRWTSVQSVFSDHESDRIPRLVTRPGNIWKPTTTRLLQFRAQPQCDRTSEAMNKTLGPPTVCRKLPAAPRWVADSVPRIGGLVTTVKRGAYHQQRTTDHRPDWLHSLPTPVHTTLLSIWPKHTVCASVLRHGRSTYLVSAVSACISARSMSASASIELYSMCKRRQ